MSAKIPPVFVICVEAIIYLLLYNLHDCTFNPLNVNSWALEKPMTMRYLYIMKSYLKKYYYETAWNYNRRESQLQQTLKINARVLAASSMHYRKCLLFLAINRKRLCQILSSVEKLIIVLLFGYLILLDFKEKSTNHIRGLYDCVIMITSRAMTNF